MYICAFLKKKKTNLYTMHYILILMSYLVWILCFQYSQSVGWADTLGKCMGTCHHTGQRLSMNEDRLFFFLLRFRCSIQIIKYRLSRLCPCAWMVGCHQCHGCSQESFVIACLQSLFLTVMQRSLTALLSFSLFVTWCYLMTDIGVSITHCLSCR